MARPKKNNADYYSHSVNMRNDPRIKALRSKFKHTGYAVWNFMLEVMSNSNFFKVEWDELNIEILAGDFDLDSEELVKIIDYCLTLKLFQKEGNFLVCQKLNEGFEGLVTKRENRASRVVSDAQTQQVQSFGRPKPHNGRVSDVHNPQSIVEYSKGEYSIVNIIKNNTLSLSERATFKNLISNKEIHSLFLEWINANAPRVNDMKEPFTQEQAIQLMIDFRGEFIEDLLKQMHNEERLYKKTSPYLTFYEMAKRRDVKPNPQITEIKIALWNNCLEQIKKQLPIEEFVKWFKPIIPLEFDGENLRLRVPDGDHAKQIEQNYIPILKPIIGQIYGKQTKLHYAVPAKK